MNRPHNECVYPMIGIRPLEIVDQRSTLSTM